MIWVATACHGTQCHAIENVEYVHPSCLLLLYIRVSCIIDQVPDHFFENTPIHLTSCLYRKLGGLGGSVAVHISDSATIGAAGSPFLVDEVTS